MLNLILYALKFIFVLLLYIFIVSLIRTVLKDTKLAKENIDKEIEPARLVSNFGKSNSKSYSLTDKVLIGRSEAADILIDNNFVSFQHARLSKRGKTYLVQDLKSTNGTFINSKRIKKETLNNGDVLTIGKTDLKFLQ